MRFKAFMENQLGLGNLGQNLNKIFRKPEFDHFAGSLLSSDMSGSEQSDTQGIAGHSLWLPSTDLTVPQVEKEGRIVILTRNENPIYIKLSDGTEGYFTYDEFKRIKGKPEIGKVMRIIFQRHPKDVSKQHSKIDHAEVIG